MKNFLNQVTETRPDLSGWLIHFVKGDPKSAPRTIDSILEHGLENRGKGLCFTESPLLGFAALLDYMGRTYPESPLYTAYGVAIRKSWFFDLGGRPVIYLPKGEFEHLKEPIQYLWEEYEPGRADFTWLREWRSNKDRLALTKENTVVVVPTEVAGEKFYEVEGDGEYEGPGEYSLSSYRNFDWHYVSLQRVREIAACGRTNDRLIDDILEGQGRDNCD